MEHKIEQATIEDLTFLMMLEKQAFIPARQFNVSSLKRAITSKSQLVYLIKYHDTNVGSAIIHVYEKRW